MSLSKHAEIGLSKAGITLSGLKSDVYLDDIPLTLCVIYSRGATLFINAFGRCLKKKQIQRFF